LDNQAELESRLKAAFKRFEIAQHNYEPFLGKEVKNGDIIPPIDAKSFIEVSKEMKAATKELYDLLDEFAQTKRNGE
jgi:hypothetical protein